MCGCETRTMKKAKSWRIDGFELWCWRRILRVPWTERRSNHSILRVISPEYSLEWLMLKLQYFATWCEKLTHWKRPWYWGRLKAKGKVGGRGWDGWMASRIQWTWIWANSGRWWGTGKPGVLQSMGISKIRIQLSNWTTARMNPLISVTFMFLIRKWAYQQYLSWTSMEVQGLRLDLPVQGAQVPSLVGRKGPHATWHGQKII